MLPALPLLGKVAVPCPGATPGVWLPPAASAREGEQLRPVPAVPAPPAPA